MLGIKHSEAGTTVLQRNQRYMHISAWGYDCYNMDIHSLNDMRLLIDTIKKYGEDGKLGVRVMFPRNNKYPTYGTSLYPIEQNAVLAEAIPVRADTLPEHLKQTFTLAWLKKDDLLKELERAYHWMDTVQKTVDKNIYKGDYTRSKLRFVVGKYRHISCTGCRRPHYEHVVTNNSFHVCPFCGMLYKHSNIQYAPQRVLNADGHIDNMKLTCAPPGQTPVKIAVRKGGRKAIIHPDNLTHKARANIRIKTMIGALCDSLGCDSGDGDDNVRKWAWKVFDRYCDFLKEESEYLDGLSGKQKMGQWQIACVFVWYAILAVEKRIFKPTVWSLSVICEKGGELHQADGYIPNWQKRGKKRKTRPVRFETVHRYATEILKEWGLDGKRYCNIEIPDIHSIDCLRDKNMESSVNMYTECVGKKIQKIYLPCDESWDMDIVLENHVVKINPDICGVAFESGLRSGDILREVNNVKVGKTVDDAYDLILSKKRKCDKNILTLTILR